MIPRFLVPFGARPPAADAAQPGRRRATGLDERKLVPLGMDAGPLDAQTKIPDYLPLDVLAARMVVPRDMPAKPLEVASAIPGHVPLSVLDSRVAIPKDIHFRAPIEVHGPVNAWQLPEVIEPDVITTGDVNLMTKPVEERVSGWQPVSRLASILFHTAAIAFILFQPKLFPGHEPTQEELELARRQLSFVYLPPSVKDIPKIPGPLSEPKSPAIRINPQTLRELIPKIELQPGPAEKERVTRDLPTPPVPNLPVAPTPQPQENRGGSPEPPRLETPKLAQSPGKGLILPNLSASPGRALQDATRNAVREPGVGRVHVGGGQIPGSIGGGGTGAQAYGGLQMLTPTEGVDFSYYLERVRASVERSWYPAIPESARMGEKGVVVLQFRIMRDGSVPYPEPNLMASSGREPMDRAAASAIHTSNPFEPLPSAFSGPYIELRFYFLYNVRPEEYFK